MTKYKFLIIAVLIPVLMASCDKGIENVAYDSTVYIPSNGIREVAPLLGESTCQIGIYWAGVNPKESGITVYLKVDADTLERYVAVNRQSNFKLLPEKYYDIPETTVNISGERSLVDIRFKNIDDTFVGMDYILPISIESVSPLVNVHPEKKTIFLHLPRFRNQYEGRYKSSGPIVSDDSEIVSRVDKENADAITVNANTIMVEGPEKEMRLLFTVKNDGTVVVSALPGPEGFNFQVQNMDGYVSEFTGTFDNNLQRVWGVFDVWYQYVIAGGFNMYVHAEFRSWH